MQTLHKYGLIKFLFCFLFVLHASCKLEDKTRTMTNKIKFSGTKEAEHNSSGQQPDTSKFITLFLCGDVMTGRGIDQILAHPNSPVIYESYLRDARGYVEIAEQKNGPIPKPVSDTYIWGYALEEFQRNNPDLRIINLETSVTSSRDYWQGKGINYRMHPKNIGCLTAAQIDFCSLANNHVLDWGYTGLSETLLTLKKVKIKSAGAGHNLQEAETPAILDVEEKGRVIVFSYGMSSSGIPSNWAATAKKPGVNYLKGFSDKTLREIKEKVQHIKQEGDLVVFSIHWGGNWGYDIPSEHIEFAHQLIDEAGVDIIHGHSSHHAIGMEIYKDKPIIYGCGDFLNDYEGISGHNEFRDDLPLMYFATMDPSIGKLIKMQLIPVQIKNFRINKASKADAYWWKEILNREGKKFGTKVEMVKDDNVLTVKWD